jgi:hypothetical protein
MKDEFIYHDLGGKLCVHRVSKVPRYGVMMIDCNCRDYDSRQVNLPRDETLGRPLLYYLDAAVYRRYKRDEDFPSWDCPKVTLYR